MALARTAVLLIGPKALSQSRSGAISMASHTCRSLVISALTAAVSAAAIRITRGRLICCGRAVNLYTTPRRAACTVTDWGSATSAATFSGLDCSLAATGLIEFPPSATEVRISCMSSADMPGRNLTSGPLARESPVSTKRAAVMNWCSSGVSSPRAVEPYSFTDTDSSTNSIGPSPGKPHVGSQAISQYDSPP